MADPDRYIGFTLEDGLNEQIEQVRQPLIDEDVRKPLVPHVTLITPPLMRQVEDDSLIETVFALEERGPIEVKLTGVHVFLENIAYIGIDSKELRDFQHSLMKALHLHTPVFQPISRVTYRPHITLLQADKDNALAKDKIKTLGSEEFPDTTTLTTFSLFEHVGTRTWRVVESLELG